MSRPIERNGQCPICGAATVHEYRPFCSRACAGRDLLNWLDERYRVPSDEAAEDTEDEASS